MDLTTEQKQDLQYVSNEVDSIKNRLIDLAVSFCNIEDLVGDANGECLTGLLDKGRDNIERLADTIDVLLNK